MTTSEGYAHPEYIAETGWLADNLDNPNVRVVDTDVVAAYQRAHIPGAIVVPDNYEKDPDTNRIHILPPDKFAQMMEALGISDDTLVVTYDHSKSLYAGRLWWALSYYSHTNVKVLNGGWKKWIEEGRPVSLDTSLVRDGAKFTAKADPSLMVTTDQLKEAFNQPGVVVWDVRNRGEYTGEAIRSNKRGGHIPGAHHMEWVELMDDRTHAFKPAVEMRRLLNENGISPEKEILAH